MGSHLRARSKNRFWEMWADMCDVDELEMSFIGEASQIVMDCQV